MIRIRVRINHPTNPIPNPNRHTAYPSPSYDTYPTNSLQPREMD